jgi:hypothetical protein
MATELLSIRELMSSSLPHVHRFIRQYYFSSQRAILLYWESFNISLSSHPLGDVYICCHLFGATEVLHELPFIKLLGFLLFL